MQEPIIKIKNLVVGFGETIVLNKLNLDVERGKILGVVGGSGCGKSVLMRTILGLIPKRAGSIHFLSEDQTHSPLKMNASREQNFGVLFQRGALFSSLNVLQNIQFQMREHLDISTKLMDEMAIAKLELVGLSPEDANKYPSELSGGMTKRVALARALALDPELLFLDEPTSGLDPISAGEFDALIRTLQKSLGLTVFMITHDLESLYEICDNIAVLAEGSVVAKGEIKVILKSDHPWVQSYFAGKRGGYVFNRLNEIVE